MTDSTRDIRTLLTRSGLTEGELLGFVEDTLAPGESARVVEALAGDADLSGLVWSLRRDRRELTETLATDFSRTPDRSAIDQAVAIGLSGGETGAIPADLAQELEETGIGKTGPRPSLVRTRAHRSRSFRLPGAGRRVAGRGVGTALAACLLLGLLGGVVWVMADAWPDPAPTRERIVVDTRPAESAFEPGRAADDFVASTDLARPMVAATRSDDAEALAGPATWAVAERIEDPAAMLAAAQEGRLVIRVVSSDSRIAASAVESITTQPSVARVAVLEGAMDRDAGIAIAGALPAAAPVVFASRGNADGARGRSGSGTPRAETSFTGAYMLRVEPTERGLSLLVAGLGRDARLSVQAVRTAEPVTTPGRVSDLVWFRSPSRAWQPRVSAPVVVETVR